MSYKPYDDGFSWFSVILTVATICLCVAITWGLMIHVSK